jgi:hypothetical protein
MQHLAAADVGYAVVLYLWLMVRLYLISVTMLHGYPGIHSSKQTLRSARPQPMRATQWC